MYYVMSDIHGCYKEMKEALRFWNPEKEHLVILGDLVDKGPDSYLVIRHLMDLKFNHSEMVTIIKGNHDEMFVSWLMDSPFDMLAYYYNETHNETLVSFFDDYGKYRKASRRQRAEHMVYKFKEELSFIKDFPYYLETEKLIFVHAGIDLDSDKWRENKREMMWVRNKFIYSDKISDKRIFFGHTPTSLIRNKESNNNLWISPNKDKVCLDGGVSMGGQLNAVKIDSDGEIIKTHIIKS